MPRISRFDFKKNNFNLIRLLAALQVLVIHGYEHFQLTGLTIFIEIIRIFPGVPIFFVVSGFLISASLERSDSIRSYYKNRLLRIYPALWVCFFVSVISFSILYKYDASAKQIVSWVIAQLTIAQFYNPFFLRDYGLGVLNGSLWTIPVELQFYIILPVIYFAFAKFKVKESFFSIIAFLSLIIVNIFFIYFKDMASEKTLLLKLFSVSIFPYLYIFLFGVFLQRNIVFVEKFLSEKFLVILIVYSACAGLAWFFGFNYKGNDLNFVNAIVLALLTISFAYSNVDLLSSTLRDDDISYGIYIYHMIFVNFLIQIDLFTPATNFIIMLVCTIIFALASWKLIEKPALSLKNYSITSSMMGSRK